MRELSEYVSSPFFNKNEDVALLIGYLRKIAPAFSLKKLQRESVYKSIFPKKAYDEKHLNYLMSFLLKLAEQYLGLCKYQEKEHLANYHILSACLERNLDKHYKNIYTKTQKKLDDHPLRDIDYYFYQFLMADSANVHFTKQKLRKYDENLQKTADNFDWYYLSSKLRQACEMLDRQKFLPANYRLQLTEQIDQYLSITPHDDIPAVAIYYCIYCMQTKEDSEAHFIRLKGMLEKFFPLFNRDEMITFYFYAINYSIRKVRQKEERFREEALGLYMSGLEKGLLYESDILSPHTYKNIISLGLGLRRFDWTETFIKKYSDKLDGEVRTNSLNFNLADLYFYRKDFSNALKHLNLVELSDIFYTLHAKILLLKIYYETDEEEPLFSLLASFRLFLKRNKLISDDIRQPCANFLSILQQLQKSLREGVEEIQQQINTTRLLIGREWLLEMCERKVK